MNSQNAYRTDLPTDELTACVSQALGRQCTLKKISGYLNRTEVFNVNDNDAVVKIYHHAPLSKFARERSAYQLLRGTNLPLARFLAQGFLTDGTPWIALSSLQGQCPDASAELMTAEQSVEFFRQWGGIARTLHGIADDPTQTIDAIMRPEASCFPESLQRYLDCRDAALQRPGPFHQLMVSAANTMDAVVKRITGPAEPRFVHGDFSSRNALVDLHGQGVTVSGLLDFERCRFGDPAQDLADMWFKDLCGDRHRHAAFVCGYGPFEVGFDDRVHWHLLGLMFEIASWAPERDPVYFQRAMQMLKAIAIGRPLFFESR
ncbi:phosphotransferase family protein [Schlesneria paludicola]|uniref:phosphotransferase family protein n=1 Tax=Schlesneria paludicola TaxID=360056 RepID=UPI00029ACC34|nr:phosphotransferase [Schlesneria paludicola]